jgi:hypothetical protein
MTSSSVAIALLTKDHPELTERSLPPLRKAAGAGLIDLFWVDGTSSNPYRVEPSPWHIYNGITGGPDSAIVFALSAMLANGSYEHVGIVEQDVELLDGWEECLNLFSQGERDGLSAGAVSARAYADRVLTCRDHYAVMHNLGSGMIVLTREAAELLLANYRTSFTSENRRVFAALTNIDIGTYWAFGANDHPITTDWGFDRILAENGLASLALVPNRVRMLDQDIASQGLAYAQGSTPVALVFETYAERLLAIRSAGLAFPSSTVYHTQTGSHLYFPHQLARLRAVFNGDWKFRWTQGFGPFSYVAQAGAELRLTLQGPAGIHTHDSQFAITDSLSGFTTAPAIGPEPVCITVPGSLPMHDVTLRALKDNSVLLAVETTLPQCETIPKQFTWNDLPKPV